MNRRRSAVLATALALITLSSCATFNRNDVAAKVGDRSLSPAAAQALGATGDQSASGDQLRQQLTKWIRVTVLEASAGTAASASPLTAADLDIRLGQAINTIAGDKAKTLYESGLTGSPVVCLAAIPVPSADDANKVLTALASGTSFADAASQFSTDANLAQTGGIVKGQDGNECIDPSTVNPVVAAALTGAPVGQPVAANLDTFSAVLLLRPYDELQPESQSLIASASIPQDQLDAILNKAKIYVDPRYGRWDPDSDSVVPLSS